MCATFKRVGLESDEAFSLSIAYCTPMFNYYITFAIGQYKRKKEKVKATPNVLQVKTVRKELCLLWTKDSELKEKSYENKKTKEEWEGERDDFPYGMGEEVGN